MSEERLKLNTGDRLFFDPDGTGVRVVEIMGVGVNRVNVWDGIKLHDVGHESVTAYRIARRNFDRYPVGQRFGEAKPHTHFSGPVADQDR